VLLVVGAGRAPCGPSPSIVCLCVDGALSVWAEGAERCLNVSGGAARGRRRSGAPTGRFPPIAKHCQLSVCVCVLCEVESDILLFNNVNY
jgi:hypothetical protein